MSDYSKRYANRKDQKTEEYADNEIGYLIRFLNDCADGPKDNPMFCAAYLGDKDKDPGIHFALHPSVRYADNPHLTIALLMMVQEACQNSIEEIKRECGIE